MKKKENKVRHEARKEIMKTKKKGADESDRLRVVKHYAFDLATYFLKNGEVSVVFEDDSIEPTYRIAVVDDRGEQGRINVGCVYEEVGQLHTIFFGVFFIGTMLELRKIFQQTVSRLNFDIDDQGFEVAKCAARFDGLVECNLKRM